MSYNIKKFLNTQGFFIMHKLLISSTRHKEYKILIITIIELKEYAKSF